MSSLIKKQARALAKKTSDAYSFDRYANWTAVCLMLLRKGYTEQQAEAIVRSKWTRWAGDASSNGYGFCTSKDLKRFMDQQPNLLRKVEQLTEETFA